jgi:hypothetical protein
MQISGVSPVIGHHAPLSPGVKGVVFNFLPPKRKSAPPHGWGHTRTGETIMSAVITRPFPTLSGAPKAPWLRFLEGDGTETPGSTPGTGTPAAGEPNPDGDKPPAQEDKVTDWKAESRKWETRAKENKDAAEKLQKLEDAQKSELQKAQDRAEKAEKRAADAERRAQELEGAQTRRDLAEKVGADKRVPVQLLMRGGGDTEESMKAYADEILAYRNGKAPGVVSKSGTGNDDKTKATSSMAAGRERFEARQKKLTTS